MTAQTGTAATTAGGSASLPSLPKLAVCINDYEPFTFLRDIKANLIGSGAAAEGGMTLAPLIDAITAEGSRRSCQASLWPCEARSCA